MSDIEKKKQELENLLSAADVALSVDDKREAYQNYLASADLCVELSELVLDKTESDKYKELVETYQEKAQKTLASMHLTPEEESKIKPRKKPKGFDEFAGMDEVKSYLKDDIVTPWMNHEMNQRSRHNLFVYGPEGCAKKVLVQSLIHELGATGYYIEPIENFSIYNFQNAESHMKVLFQKAEEKDNVVFFIERPVAYFPQEYSKESKKVFKKFYKLFSKEMKRIKKKNLNIIFVGASSLPDMINPKVFTDLFFDDFVRIHHPNHDTRLQIIKERLAGLHFENDECLERLATVSHHFVTKDVSRLCRSVKKLAGLYAKDGETPVVTNIMIEKVISDFTPNDDVAFAKAASEFEGRLPTGHHIIHG